MCPILGGNWNNGTNAGVWNLNLNNVRTNSNTNVGFRSDSAILQNAIAYSRAKGDVFRLLAKSDDHRLLSSISRHLRCFARKPDGVL
jgi:hypothetical protein